MALNIQKAKAAGYSDQEIKTYLESQRTPIQKVAGVAAKAAPIIGTTIGGLAGTVISPILGSAAGAAAGYAGGRAIGESIQDLTGIQDESAPEAVKSLAKETAITGGTSVALGVAGKGLNYVGGKVVNAVAPKLQGVGKSLSEMVVPPKIKGTSPDLMSKADDVFAIRQKLGLKGAPSDQARQAQAIWEANKKTVETLLKEDTAKIPARAIKGSVDDAVANTIGFDDLSNIGKKTIKQAKDMLSGSKNSHELFIAQQKIGNKAFTGMPSPEKDFLKELYGKVGNLIQEVSPVAREKISENSAIRTIFPSLKSAIGKEAFSSTEALGTVVGALNAPGGIPGKLGAAATGFGLSTKPGMVGMDYLSRLMLKAGVKKEATKKLLSSGDFLKAIMSTIPSATKQ